MNIVYFDLETQRTANDIGGWEKKSDMGMSLGVTYSTNLTEYRIYPEKRVDDLIQQLLRADLVVGFNVVDFDYQVLMGYTIGIHHPRSPSSIANFGSARGGREGRTKQAQTGQYRPGDPRSRQDC